MSAEETPEVVGLPLGRVRRLMKDATHIRAVTQEASLLVTKAAELFVASLTARATCTAFRDHEAHPSV